MQISSDLTSYYIFHQTQTTRLYIQTTVVRSPPPSDPGSILPNLSLPTNFPSTPTTCLAPQSSVVADMGLNNAGGGRCRVRFCWESVLLRHPNCAGNRESHVYGYLSYILVICLTSLEYNDAHVSLINGRSSLYHA